MPDTAPFPKSFQSTRPQRARRVCFGRRLEGRAFQSTRPRRARREHRSRFGVDIMFQSTRPRRARRTYQPSARPFPLVSIYAPAKGATTALRISPRRTVCFNLRAREGRDAWEGGLKNGTATVSIHAPAKGATALAMASATHLFPFQSTRPRRARRHLT